MKWLLKNYQTKPEWVDPQYLSQYSIFTLYLQNLDGICINTDFNNNDKASAFLEKFKESVIYAKLILLALKDEHSTIYTILENSRKGLLESVYDLVTRFEET